MERFVLFAAMALCGFAFWALARNDLIRLVRPARRVQARVSGHRESWSDAARTYAAVYAFSDEHGEHQVTDPVYSSGKLRQVGDLVELTYPAGRPDLARPPRPLLWLVVYAALGYGLAVLIGKASGWLD
jgi:hypothetical protein